MDEERYACYPAYKSSGVEWLGEIPTHWGVRRVKFLGWFQYGDSLPQDLREDGEVPVYGSNGIVGTHSSANTLAPCIVIGRKGSYGKINYSAKPVFAIDTTFFIDARSARANIRWLYYALSLLGLDSFSQDSAVPGLSREFAHNQYLPDISVEEQQAIVDFLDRQTAVLDDLIREKQALIQLLQEKRTALISRAVTQGLDPNVPMKESGVPWVGRVPAHWRIIRLRYVVQNFVDYRGRTPEKVPNGIPLVTARNIINGKIDFSLSEEFIREEDYESWMVRGFPEIGDVLVTTEAPLGDAAQVVDTNIALAQRIVLLKVYQDRITNEYLKNYILSSAGQGELWSRATGSTALGIKASWLKTISVLVPPLREQRDIFAYVDEETAQVDRLIAEIEAGIATLREYRAALIAAAVTGQIDVRSLPLGKETRG